MKYLLISDKLFFSYIISASLSTLKDVLMASTKSSECADNLSTSVESSVTTVKPSPRVPHRSKTAHIDRSKYLHECSS